MEKEPILIEAEEGKDFQEYMFEDGKRVPYGTSIGVEVYNPRTKETELHLFEDIRFSSESFNEVGNDKNA